MQHVDDALLIAYADDALDAADRQLVDEHLAGCAVCRGRVEEERALARRAGAVLSAVAPAVQPVPPFDEVLRRRNKGSAAGRRAWIPLAWAASLVVAIGAGWMANELLLAPAMQQPVERASAGDAAAARNLAEPQAAEAQAESQATESQDEGLRQASAPAAGADAETDDAPSVRETAPSSTTDAVHEHAESMAAPPPPVAQLGASDAAAERKTAAPSAAAPAPAPALAAEQTRARAERGVASLAAADAVVTMELDAADVAWRGTRPADAPGAPVRAVADVAIDSVWLAHDSADWRTRVLHRLEQGPLEVIEWRRAPWQGVVASGTLPDGRRYLLGRSDSVLVELRGRLDAATLEALLARIRPLP